MQYFTMQADGGNVKQITNGTSSDMYGAWNPEGSRVAFVSNRDGNNEIYVMNADGSGKRRLWSTLVLHSSNVL